MVCAVCVVWVVSVGGVGGVCVCGEPCSVLVFGECAVVCVEVFLCEHLHA